MLTTSHDFNVISWMTALTHLKICTLKLAQGFD